MPASRASKRGLRIARDQHHTSREIFLAEVADSLPRVPLGHATAWQAGRDSIDRSIQADRWLRQAGFNRWGQPLASRDRRGGT